MIPVWFYILVGLIGLQRVGELALNRRNARRLVADGGQLVRDDGYGLLVAVHGCWFLLLLFESWASPQAGIHPWTVPALALFGVGEGLRAWSMASLKGRWTTRIYVLPKAPLVATGPYRLLRHPIYIGVSLQLVALPLAFGLWGTAATIAVLNTTALVRRIRREDAALRESTA